MINAKHINHLRVTRIGEKSYPSDYKKLFWISLLHVPLGVFIYNVGSLAILHPAAVFFAGMYLAIKKKEKLEHIALVAGYLIGSEVLWRMAQVPVLWEFGKYGSCLIMIVALIRRRRFNFPALPLVYFFLLLPACILTLIEADFAKSRENLSFNLSGPFSLMISCWFFSNIRTNGAVLKKVLFSLLVPLISVAFATLFYTVTAENISFTSESNFATSGGFGPNQVSSMLGLGAFIALLSFIIFGNDTKEKIYLALMTLFFAAQSVMTFSRGGMYNAMLALVAVLVLSFRNPSNAIKKLIPVAVLASLFLVVIFPVLNNFTGGSLLERFEEVGTTTRVEIIESDFEIFWENPVLGAGVGRSYSYREKFLDHKAASHTEFSRLISEHGLFGIFAVLCMIMMILSNFVRQSSNMGRAFVLGSSVWCVLFMLNAGMRLAAPSFMWGLIFVTVTEVSSSKRIIRSGLTGRARPSYKSLELQ